MEQVRQSYHLDLAEESVWLTATPGPETKASIPYVQELGDFIAGAGYDTRRENLPSYLIKYTLSGEGELTYEGRTSRVHAGQAFWIDCTKPQYYRTAPGATGWRVRWVHFYGATCETYYSIFLNHNNGENVVDLDSDVAVGSALTALLSLYGDGAKQNAADVQAAEYLVSVMTRCILSASASGAEEGLPAFVRDARRFLDIRYAERVTLDSLSHALSINKFYLQKTFTRYIGMSPNEYLIRTRLTKAKQLLRTTQEPIAQIAFQVGMGGAEHFSRLFRAREGITPAAYRRRWNSAERG